MKVPAVDLLVVGLPVAQFKAKRAALERSMVGSFVIGKRKRVEVKKVLVVAQPQGALFDYAAQNGMASLEHGRSLVIDVGSRTFDWLTTRGLRVITKMSNSMTRGVSDILLGVAAKIGSEIKEDFRDLDMIDKALRSGKAMRIYKNEFEIKRFDPLIQKISEQAVGAMVQTMDSTHDVENIVLVGGGAWLFKRAIAKHFPRHDILQVPDPLYANVRGFQRIGEIYVREHPDEFETRTPTAPEQAKPAAEASMAEAAVSHKE